MTPEEAREILGRFLDQKVTTQQAEKEEAYTYWLVQLELTKGGLDQAGNVIDQRRADRSKNLAKLHTEITKAAHGGPTLERGQQEEHDRLLAEIVDEARLKLAAEGLPEEWQP